MIEPYDKQLKEARDARDQLKTRLVQTQAQHEQARTEGAEAKRKVDGEAARLANVKADLKAAAGYLAQADAKYDQELYSEAYIHAAEQLQKTIDRAKRDLVEPDAFETGIKQAWDDWFAKKENARALEQQHAQEKRALELAEAELQRLERGASRRCSPRCAGACSRSARRPDGRRITATIGVITERALLEVDRDVDRMLNRPGAGGPSGRFYLRDIMDCLSPSSADGITVQLLRFCWRCGHRIFGSISLSRDQDAGVKAAS